MSDFLMDKELTSNPSKMHPNHYYIYYFFNYIDISCLPENMNDHKRCIVSNSLGLRFAHKIIKRWGGGTMGRGRQGGGRLRGADVEGDNGKGGERGGTST